MSTTTVFPEGTSVKVVGLQQSPEWNGRLGTVKKFFASKRRYAVELMKNIDDVAVKCLSVKGENLERVLERVERQELCCMGCRKILVIQNLFQCSKCRMANYCSKECQVEHWRSMHKNDCELLRSARKAKDDHDKLPTDQGDRIYARQQRGAHHMEQRNFVAAEAEFRAIINEENAHWVNIYLNLASCLSLQSKLTQALEVLEMCVRLDTSYSEDGEKTALASAYQQMGELYWRIGGDRNDYLRRATESYRKSLEYDITDAHTWKQLVRVLEKQDDLDGMRDAIRGYEMHVHDPTTRSIPSSDTSPRP